MIQASNIEANGLRFGIQECGEGPLILCLHGFPDTAETWGDLMPRLADAGYRVVAPSMRGYAPTAIPEDRNYSIETLGRDVLALIEALGYDSAVVVGHDWGALAAYAAANLEPARVNKLVTLAIPHPRVIRVGPSLFKTAWHLAFFQLRPLALRSVRKNDFALIDRLYRQWSPNWNVQESDLEPIKSALAKPGVLEAALGYYWQMGQDLVNPLKLPSRRKLRAKTSVPTLSIAGERDGALPERFFQRAADAFSGTYRYERLSGAGHFVHRERPVEVAAVIAGFLAEVE